MAWNPYNNREPAEDPAPENPETPDNPETPENQQLPNPYTPTEIKRQRIAGLAICGVLLAGALAFNYCSPTPVPSKDPKPKKTKKVDPIVPTLPWDPGPSTPPPTYSDSLTAKVGFHYKVREEGYMPVNFPSGVTPTGDQVVHTWEIKPASRAHAFSVAHFAQVDASGISRNVYAYDTNNDGALEALVVEETHPARRIVIVPEGKVLHYSGDIPAHRAEDLFDTHSAMYTKSRAEHNIAQKIKDY